VKDLDEVTTKEEVLESLIAEFGEIQLSAASIVSLRRAYGGTQIATIRLPAKSAEKLLEAEKVRIGWVVCRVRRKTTPIRCFKCMEFGHVAGRCPNAEDCAGACFKCGEKGHQAKTCKNAAKCLLCSRKGEEDTKHPANSVLCPLFKRALTRTKRK